jgi:uncharacterized membrane protein YhaH (DUF805 family)
MGFSEAVRTCLKLKYATFQGRASRSEYWYFLLFVMVVALVLSGLAFLLVGANGFADMQNGGSMPVGAMVLFGLVGLFYLGVLLPSIAVGVRRFHDRNLSGWYYLGAIVLGIVPFVGFLASIAAFVITVLKGTEGPNKFGRDPLGPDHSADVFN